MAGAASIDVGHPEADGRQFARGREVVAEHQQRIVHRQDRQETDEKIGQHVGVPPEHGHRHAQQREAQARETVRPATIRLGLQPADAEEVVGNRGVLRGDLVGVCRGILLQLPQIGRLTIHRSSAMAGVTSTTLAIQKQTGGSLPEVERSSLSISSG